MTNSKLINFVRSLNKLTEAQLQYLVLRVLEYYLLTGHSFKPILNHVIAWLDE